MGLHTPLLVTEEIRGSRFAAEHHANCEIYQLATITNSLLLKLTYVPSCVYTFGWDRLEIL